MIQAIAVDMDGTFLNSKKQYDKTRFDKIFAALKDKQVTFIAASGNQYAKLKSIFGIRDMYYVSENGAVIYHGDQLYDYRSFNRQTYQAVVDYLNLEQGLKELVICGLHSAYILKDTPQAFKENTRFYYHQLQEIDSLQELPDDEYVKIAFNINRETHPHVDEAVANHFSKDIKLVSSGHDSIDIIMPNMTKGQALGRLLKTWEMSAEDLMAFGDANNDKDMLELAQYSYVMANSQDKSLFDIASAIAPSNDEQGVLTVIEQQVLS